MWGWLLYRDCDVMATAPSNISSFLFLFIYLHILYYLHISNVRYVHAAICDKRSYLSCCWSESVEQSTIYLVTTSLQEHTEN